MNFKLASLLRVQFAADLLGLPLVPSYSQASSVQEVLQGANYASAAAGILDDSGGNFVSTPASCSCCVHS
jgi:hypothetical protein